MALIVEDGSIVAGANTYVTLTDVKSYADDRGITYPDDAKLEQNIILSTDYLQSKCYQGQMVEPSTQPLLWPRQDIYINGEAFPSDAIPSQLKNAQIETALAQEQVKVLTDGTDPGDNIKREKTDVLETEYFEGGRNSTFTSERVNYYLRYLLRPLGLCRV